MIAHALLWEGYDSGVATICRKCDKSVNYGVQSSILTFAYKSDYPQYKSTLV